MSRTPPTPPAEPAPLDPVLLAAADLRKAAAELRDETAALRLERRAHAELLAERDRLIEEIHMYQKANMLLLDKAFQTLATPQHAANGSTDVH